MHVSGRRLAQTSDNSKIVKEGKTLWRAQIGSRPPRCERRCGSCARCQAIQVPTNPQISGGVHSSIAAAAAVRDESSSNYKPMSWKCKCGNLIFNP
ncbi:hypothetical protein C2S51_016853 [Perilla frutescens var. frutescens]|nr:hypothetical protein C2S51_016853 [Perilla frutescens var. frutescens]